MQTHTAMSPFTFAAEIKAPILLTYGGAHDNSGKYSLERRDRHL
nr:hypothetical protein [Novosphingobium panipatense]